MTERECVCVEKSEETSGDGVGGEVESGEGEKERKEGRRSQKKKTFTPLHSPAHRRTVFLCANPQNPTITFFF